MCGRVFLSTDGDAIAAVLGLLHDGKATGLPHADLPPTVTLPVVAVGRQGPVVTGMRWGLVPHGWREPKPPAHTFNARRETLAEVPSFRGLLAGRRAVVPVSGFYEWKAAPGAKPSARKVRYVIRPRDGGYLWLASLWDAHRDRDGVMRPSVTVITQPSDGPLADLHARMPWCLSREEIAGWIDAGTPWSAAARMGAAREPLVVAAATEATC